MSYYLNLGKSPESFQEREALIKKIIAHELYLDSLQITSIQRRVISFLIHSKNYSIDDFEINKLFKIDLGNITFEALADILIKERDRSVVVVKCVTNSLDSWERYAMAFCRVADREQIPIAIVTDGESLRIIDSVSGSVVDGIINLFPEKGEIGQFIKKQTIKKLPASKIELEKRIVYAFEGIKCPMDK
ncbi:MAG: hypothetical protein N3A59_05010 [Thermodesulfovibrionales bacterium]|nr:hypothetical protein [Thermodesulfovibrionales bacterium]